MNNIEIAVQEIIDDICNRKGLKQAFEGCDEEVQEEIRKTWYDIIAEWASQQ